MSPTQYALWRKQLAELYAYVESIDFDVSNSIADSRICASNNECVASSAGE